MKMEAEDAKREAKDAAREQRAIREAVEEAKTFREYLEAEGISYTTLLHLIKANIIPGWTGEGTIKNFGDDNISPGPEYFEQLFRVSRNQIIWGGNYYLLPPSRGFLIWRKTTVAENFSMAMCEYAWMSFDSNSKIFEAAPQGTKKDPRIHPTQKPVALYAWIFQHYAKPGDRILDTHLGSGSSRIAAWDAGLDFTGYEIDPEYFEAQEKRFQQHTEQMSLFGGGVSDNDIHF